ncbi:hypothetical protein KF913_16485 [Candidatus Obscuribacterales bacterium]|nr:hypothetical protein [Candidatus Obscuribacterales bacterium]
MADGLGFLVHVKNSARQRVLEGLVGFGETGFGCDSSELIHSPDNDQPAGCLTRQLRLLGICDNQYEGHAAVLLQREPELFAPARAATESSHRSEYS